CGLRAVPARRAAAVRALRVVLPCGGSCQSPRKNLTKNRPLQIRAAESVGKSTSANRGSRNLTKNRPLQIQEAESVGKSTSATHSVAQVAFSSVFFLSFSVLCFREGQAVAQVAFSSGFSFDFAVPDCREGQAAA
ncbi:MAG: hypothetical protein IKG18_07710, partial [Atopobiaceae bacterium]|nr:hypothetical protein [Atopobiaceae bacterium]